MRGRNIEGIFWHHFRRTTHLRPSGCSSSGDETLDIGVAIALAHFEVGKYRKDKDNGWEKHVTSHHRVCIEDMVAETKPHH